MLKLSATPLNMILRHTFTIARSSVAWGRNVLVKIQHGDHEGLGEAAPVAFYGQSQQSCLRAVKRMGERIARRDPFELEEILVDLKKHFPKEPSAIAAVDIALHDLIGKKLGLPLWKYFGLNPSQTPQTSFTIGIDTLSKVALKVAEAEKYPTLKIKVGVANDLEIMRQVRQLAPRKTLRVDANCGWTVREAIRKAKALEKLDVEFIEQPIPPGNNAALKKIKNAIGLPLLADESSLTPEDIPDLCGCVDGINIKLIKCGGLREALKMIYIARDCGMKIMIGCMIESSVLITAAAHLTPLLDYADLDGNLLITDDPYCGVTLDRQARLRLPNTPGLGLTVRH
ncbi:MAG: dipeptide epimerase [Planctomycetota bacterium]